MSSKITKINFNSFHCLLDKNNIYSFMMFLLYFGKFSMHMVKDSFKNYMKLEIKSHTKKYVVLCVFQVYLVLPFKQRSS